jgi:hypothetical protein
MANRRKLTPQPSSHARAARGRNLMLRLYWPKEHLPSLLNGTWQPPAAERVT